MRPILSLIALAFALPASAADDILLADFEGEKYAEGWKTTGTAFGDGPAMGTLPGQMAVSGFLGKGLVNSFKGGDDAVGTLTSPEFKVERKYLNFLIGGGKHPGKACINLVVDGKTIRTATGPNDRPGGTEHLAWHTWDVADLAGKTATIQIVDEQKGGWGHINIDHIVQSDKKKQAEPFTAEIDISKNYLHLPVKTGAPMKRMSFTVGGEIVREFDIELDVSEKPQFWAFADVSAFHGKHLTIATILPSDSRKPSFIESDGIPDSEKVYREKHRPLFHFTSRFGWLNDPNGLVYHDGEWHLFYQHNPFGVNWGNMHWGHAVSKDLFRWKELGIGLYPKKYGDMAFSGSAVLDKGNTSGWGTKEKPPLVLAYTSTGRGECISYSNDHGRTWTEYEKNPVLKHAGRDPKLVWYPRGQHWVMAVYDEFQGKQWIAFHTSKDLKTWTFASRIEGFFECPDLFEMGVIVGFEEKGSKWVLYGADGKYMLGEFDGREFKPDSKVKSQLWYGNFYAAQTFDNSPLRFPAKEAKLPSRVQVGWANGVSFPGMPFNQQMTIPVTLTLRGDGVKPPRLTAHTSVASLRDGKSLFDIPEGKMLPVPAGGVKLGDELDAFEVEMWVAPLKSTGFTLDLRGTKLVYDHQKQTLTCKNVTAPVEQPEGFVYLHVLVDRGSVEVFSDYGTVAMSIAAVPDDKNRKMELVPQGGEIKLFRPSVYRLKSAWDK